MSQGSVYLDDDFRQVLKITKDTLPKTFLMVINQGDPDALQSYVKDHPDLSADFSGNWFYQVVYSLEPGFLTDGKNVKILNFILDRILEQDWKFPEIDWNYLDGDIGIFNRLMCKGLLQSACMLIEMGFCFPSVCRAKHMVNYLGDMKITAVRGDGELEEYPIDHQIEMFGLEPLNLHPELPAPNMDLTLEPTQEELLYHSVQYYNKTSHFLRRIFIVILRQGPAELTKVIHPLVREAVASGRLSDTWLAYIS